MTRRYTIKRDLPRKFLVNYKTDLNTEQYDVVTTGRGPVLVIAAQAQAKLARSHIASRD
jgi:hypothetical protein